jgi:hypothetical protein
MNRFQENNQSNSADDIEFFSNQCYQSDDEENSFIENSQDLIDELALFFERNDIGYSDVASTIESDDASDTTCSDDFSSIWEEIEDESQSSSYSGFSCRNQLQKKQIRFGTVEIREYGVTVGAYTGCRDSCPIQLTWEHTPSKVRDISSFSGKGIKAPKYVKRLSIADRRAMISRVQGISEESVLQMEYRVTLQTIQDSMKCISLSSASQHRTGKKILDKRLGMALLNNISPLPLVK